MKKVLFTMLLSVQSLWLFAQTTRMEAESATLTSGAVKVADATCSGGFYVATNAGDVSFSVNTSTDTYYDIYLNIASPDGDKTQNFVIDAHSSTFVIPKKTSYTRIKVASFVKLTKGSHTIKITKNWGWVNVDYLELKTVDASARFNITANLVTPSPTAATKCVYSFLKDNYGKHMISGVMTANMIKAGGAPLPLYSQDEVKYIYDKTGKYPALVGFDFINATGLHTEQQWYKDVTNAAVTMATELWNKGGIPTFCWHWRNPIKNDVHFYSSASNPADITSFKLTSAFTSNACTSWNTSSAAYKALIADIDVVAGYLKQLQSNGVTVVWRPLHEAAGEWFWWGASGSVACKSLYHLQFDRLVNHHGLKNLIWVWTNEPNEGGAWYPGDSYVDIVGRDIYADGNHGSQIMEFNTINSLHNTKIISLSECGSFPDEANLVNDGAAWSWFMPWCGKHTTDVSYNSVALWKKNMTSNYVISLDEMPGWANYCSALAPVVSSFTPSCLSSGTSVTITGTNLASALNVKFNGIAGTIISNTATNIVAKVPTGATSGTITVTTSAGTDASSGSYSIAALPTVVIELTAGNNPGCVGNELKFTAARTNGGSAPSYQWKVNGANSGTGTVFTSSSLANGDAVSCVLTSNGACVSTTTATSNTISPVIYTNKTPTVAIAITAGTNPSNAGTELEFTATATNSGSAPSYQWKVNAVNAGTDNKLFSSSTLLDTDVVSCTVTSNGLCVTTPTATSNSITLSRIVKLTQTIVLHQGWNLISTNVQPQDTSIATLFATLDVQEIKNANSFWLKGQAFSLNGLATLTPGQAYLVKMNTAGTITLIGTPISEILQVASLPSGWNLIGCPFQTATSLSSILTASTCKSVKSFDGFWIPSGTGNSLSDFEPGYGYFIYK